MHVSATDTATRQQQEILLSTISHFAVTVRGPTARYDTIGID